MHLSRKESRVVHNLLPFYDKDSEILILGSMPSIKSRSAGFYYAHPQNRFFKILADIYEEVEPISIEDKKHFLKKHKIALWDVIKSCTIIGSSDSSIKDVVVNDIKTLIKDTNIKYIYTTGKKAYNLYNKYLLNDVGIKAIYLPSSSPANQTKKYSEIVEEYKRSIIN